MGCPEEDSGHAVGSRCQLLMKYVFGTEFLFICLYRECLGIITMILILKTVQFSLFVCLGHIPIRTEKLTEGIFWKVS